MLKDIDFQHMEEIPSGHSSESGVLAKGFGLSNLKHINIFDINTSPRFRGRAINQIARHVVREFFVSMQFGPNYRAFSGRWHSEGSKIILLSALAKYPTIEIFLFEHMIFSWDIRLKLHYSNGRIEQMAWYSDAATMVDIEADLARQLASWVTPGGADKI